MDTILILNAGSSSLKFAIYEADGRDPIVHAKGQIEALATSPRLIVRSGDGAVLEDRLIPKDDAHAHEISAAMHPRHA